MNGRLAGFICLCICLALWQLAASLGWIPQDRFSSPYEILAGIGELARKGLPPGYTLQGHIFYSLKLVGAGFLLACVTAIPLGLLVGSNKLARLIFGPILEFFRPVPPLAWIPVAMLWFGIGFPSAVFIIFLGAFFPIFVNTSAGVMGVSEGLIGSALILGAKRSDIWFKVLLPASLPNIITGIRLGIGIAWMTLVAAEFTGVRDGYGLGYMIMTARDLQRLDLVLAGMVVIGIIGLGIERSLKWLSARLLRGR